MGELIGMAAAILLHEVGHLFMAKIFGIPCLSAGFRPGGAVITFDFAHTSYAREGMVHAAGALTGLFSAIPAWLIFGERVYFFLGITLVLSFVNLLPIIGMDGGAILGCIMSQFLMPDTVWRVQKIVSISAILVLWGMVLWIELRVGPNFSLLAFVLCVIFGAIK